METWEMFCAACRHGSSAPYKPNRCGVCDSDFIASRLVPVKPQSDFVAHNYDRLRADIDEALETVSACALDDEDDFTRVLNAVTARLTDILRLQEEFLAWREHYDPNHDLHTYSIVFAYMSARGVAGHRARELAEEAMK